MDSISETGIALSEAKELSETGMSNMDTVKFFKEYGGTTLVSGGGRRLAVSSGDKMMTMGVNISIGIAAVGRGENPYGFLLHTNRENIDRDFVDFLRN